MENKNDQRNPAKYAFFYLLSLFALVFTALPTGIIIFQLINKFVSDPLTNYATSFNMESLKFAISAVVIAAPIFFLTMRQIVKSLKSGQLDSRSGVRKWLTYFILFVSSVVMIVWLIMTINSYLNGDLTLKFILKALTAIGISALVFSYYFFDIKREQLPEKDNLNRSYFFASLALVLAVFVASLFIVDSPAQTRAIKLDGQVVNNLSNIRHAVDNYFRENGKLPADLSQLRSDSNYLLNSDFQDPVSGKAYEYQAKEDRAYELCADFRTDNEDIEGRVYYYEPIWRHPVGRKCFSLKVTENPDKALID